MNPTPGSSREGCVEGNSNPCGSLVQLSEEWLTGDD
jgi:hypothetical protein